MFEVRARKFEDGVAIYCNDKGQAIGPKKTRNELTRFLGTIAHDYNWAPLTYTNWQKVPDKDKIWEYVNRSLLSVCTYEKRLNSRLDNVPEDHFKLLLKYWASTPTKNAKNRQQQDNMHTCGPVAFAMISDEMFQQDGEVPFKRKLFERTRS
ncbi:Protein phosphatase PP2A regulatory subunit A [Bienertia sinuspersici]